MYYDYRPMVTLGAVCIMEDNGKIENSYASRAFRMGAEFLTDDIIAEVAKEAVEKPPSCSRPSSLKEAKCQS